MESIGSKEESHEEPTTVSEWSEMALPGFRFHPTEEELVGYYLRRMVQGRRNSVELIASLDLYQYDPWELPAMAFMGEKEWFFFCPRDKKYPNGARPNRVTASGYWKATGTDRPVRCSGDSRCIGLKKTLVFYTGRAPRGNKTEWIMNEYRMPKPAERSISVMTSGVNSISYSFSTYDNFVIKNDVALCRIYRKSSSALNSVSFISAIGARDLEERTSRMMSRFENNPAAGTQQQHHNHVQRLQGPVSNINVRVSSEMPMASLSSAAASSDNGSGQQQSATKAASMVTVTHSQLVDAAETQRQQQQQQQLIDGSAQGSFDHGVSSMMDCSTTSEEASRQLQIALRTAMAKLDGVGSSTTVNFNDGESLDSNGSGVFGRFRSRLVQDAGARPSASVMRSPSPEAAAAVTLNHNRSSRVSPTTTHEHFSHPLNSSRDIKIATTLLRSSSSETVAVAFSPIKNDPTCTAPRVSIQSSFSHHVNSSPSTNTTSTTTQCVESAGGSVAPSAIAHHTINNNNCSNLSPSSISQLEGEVQSLVNACSIPPLSNTYSLKRSRFTRVQPLGGEHCPMAKMPSVAQYWRQSSSAPAAAATAAPQLSTFDALSGLTFEY